MAVRTLTHTYTRTWPLLHAWASTFPWECERTDHDHDPMVDDPCSVPDCGAPLRAREVCYAVIEHPARDSPPPQRPGGRVRDREQWVCWRHIRPDAGPLRVP